MAYDTIHTKIGSSRYIVVALFYLISPLDSQLERGRGYWMALWREGEAIGWPAGEKERLMDGPLERRRGQTTGTII